MSQRRRNRGTPEEEAKRLERAVSAVLDGDRNCRDAARAFEVDERRVAEAVRGKRLMMGGHNRSTSQYR